MSKTKNLTFTALSLAIIIVSGFIKIPFYPVSFTLQSAVIILVSLVYGYMGFFATLIYVFMGLLGLPIFTGGGGFGYIFTASFGYIVGFVIASLLCVYLAKYNKIFLTSIICSIIILLVGSIYAMILFQTLSFGYIALNFFAIFLPGELLKCILIKFTYKPLCLTKK